MKVNKLAMVGSLGGIIIGCSSWIVILGISLDFFSIIILPVIFGLVCLFFSLKIYSLYSERSLSIIGSALAWFMALNFFIINFLYEFIPKTVWKDAPREYAQLFTTGKSQFGLLFINIWLSIFILVAVFLIIVDIIQNKKKD
ncbi:MAG: hypothetical protein K9L84_00025 [Candidatus Omnitrophica bacterium]|nr:hypothetical protein [Candidatus Omnitrophota bacterium]MCF7893437.1 hypothetical protein [Candidatus Omnitrophota bacterium]